MYTSRACGIIFRDDKGRVILQHRDKDAPTRPGYWSFFGGQMEEGETPEQTVRRELKEELGIELADLKFFKRYEHQGEDGVREVFIFIAPLTIPIERLKKQQREGQGLGIFTFEQLKDLKISDNSRAILKDLFNK